jgi:hypothetical protein
MDDFKVIYKILKFFKVAMDVEEPDFSEISPENLGISEKRWHQLIFMMVDNGYLSGVMRGRAISMPDKAHLTEYSQITLQGLEYLSENSMMQKAYRAAKGIVDLIP